MLLGLQKETGDQYLLVFVASWRLILALALLGQLHTRTRDQFQI